MTLKENIIKPTGAALTCMIQNNPFPCAGHSGEVYQECEVSTYEHPEGCRYHQRFCLSDFPNDLISIADLVSLGINLVDVDACCGSPTL